MPAEILDITDRIIARLAVEEAEQDAQAAALGQVAVGQLPRHLGELSGDPAL